MRSKIRRNHEYCLIYSKEQFKLEKAVDSGQNDILPEEFTNWILSTWSIQPETKKLGNHPCPYPTELPLRLCKLYSYVNDIILDPFNGVGTTTLAAKITNRRYIGIDMEKDYCEYAQNRLIASENIFEWERHR